MKYCGPIIDGHIHVEGWYDEKGNSFYEGFDSIFNRRGLKSMNIAALPICEWGTENNIITALYKLHNPRVYIHGGITYPSYPVKELPEGARPEDQYRELMAIGFDGMKNLETKPQYHKQISNHVDLPFYEPYFEALERDGTHLLWHVCDPRTFWDINSISREHIALGWYYGDGSYDSYDEIMGQVLYVLRRHPRLNVTFAHFFFHSECPEKLEGIFAEFPNVSVDLTPGTEMYDDFRDRNGYYREFFARNANRLSFGTDTSFPDASDTLFNNVVKCLSGEGSVSIHSSESLGLDLPPEVCAKIFHENFERKVAPSPKPVDPKALKAYIEKYKAWIKDPEVARLVSAAAESL